jgi:DNA polymerase-3 subunit beta
MKFKTTKFSLLAALTDAALIADPKAPDIFGHVLLVGSEGQGVTARAWGNQSTAIEVGMFSLVTEGGKMFVPVAKYVVSAIKAMSDGELIVSSASGSAFDIRSSTGTSTFRATVEGNALLAEPAVCYENKSRLIIEHDRLASIIESVAFAVSPDESRPSLNSLFFEVDKTFIRAVATDGHRLSKSEIDVELPRVEPFTALVPLFVLEAWQAMLASATKREKARAKEAKRLARGVPAYLSFSERTSKRERHLRLTVDNITVSFAVNEDAQFPSYRKVIPESYSREAKVASDGILPLLKGAKKMASDRTGAIKLQLMNGSIGVSAENPDGGAYTSSVSADSANRSEEYGFNAKYLIDAIESMRGRTLRLGLSNPLDPIKITDVSPGSVDSVHIIMPTRL